MPLHYPFQIQLVSEGSFVVVSSSSSEEMKDLLKKLRIFWRDEGQYSSVWVKRNVKDSRFFWRDQDPFEELFNIHVMESR
jgi:hypothetical protein